MKKIFLLILVCMISTLQLSCAMFSEESEDSSDNAEVSSETEKLEEGDVENDGSESADEALDAETTAENSEDDIQTDFPDEENVEQDLANQNQPEQTPVEETPPAPIVEKDETLEPAIESDLDKELGGPVRITSLDYKANENGGTFVIQTDGVAQYKTEQNSANNQYIIEIQNASLPKQFKRPFNTKEFSGAIGLISAYQKSGTNDVRVVVQLKKPTDISVVQEGNSLLVVPGTAIAAAPADATPMIEAEGSATEEPSVQLSEEDKQLSLQSKTLDEFLMGETKFYGKKISLELFDADVREVINFISEESGVNLILGEAVSGKISLKLRKIPWDQALVLIMQSKQLGYMRQGNVLRVDTLGSIRAETEANKQLIESQKLLEPLKVKIFPVSYSTAGEMAPQVQGFLSPRGSAKPDARTNNLVVRDIAENIAKVDKLIQKLDTQTAQVYIEAKIIESRVTLSRNLGISWDTFGESSVGYGIFTGSIAKGGSVGVLASLKILEADSKVKILSSPRIVTLNNQAATIQQTTQFPTFSTTLDPETNVLTKKIEYKSVNLNLSVTPQITAEGGVILKTSISRDYAGAVEDADTGARSLNTRSANSTVIVGNGQTAVLGGIYSTDNTESNSGLPLIRKIPLIGWLFGSDLNTYDKNELMIFLTPRVLNKDKAFLTGDSGSDMDNL